jgi:cytochrome c oxidase cbb3-type subunit 3
MRNLSDEIIFKTIKFGGEANKKSSLMPPWDGVLSDDEIRDLVKYLRKLCCE